MAETNYKKLYEFLGVRLNSEKEDECVGFCPFHEDDSPSFAFDKVTGLWKCFANCGHGNVFHFICKKFKVAHSDAEDVLKALLNPISDDWETCHNDFVANTQVNKFFTERKGINLETIQKYKIGFDGSRFTIPIVIGGVLVNIRKYMIDCPKGQTKVTAISGYNEPKLFPYDNVLASDKLYLMEGETDCLLANQLGLNAVTVTAGAGTWKEEWGLLFKEREIETVIICYDIDKKGRDAADKIRDRLIQYVKKVIVVRLPITEPANGDFTDYIHGQGHTLQEFLELEKHITIEVKKDGEKVEVSDVPIPTTLYKSSGSTFWYKRVALTVIINGKNLTPYMIPRKICYTCKKIIGASLSHIKGKCLYCEVAKSGGYLEKIIDEKNQCALKFVNCHDLQLRGYVREAGGIPQSCPHYTFELTEMQNVEEVRVIPDIATEFKQVAEYVSRVVYFLDVENKRVKTNAGYEINGIVMPMPNSQLSTILISKVTPSQTDIDTFEIDDKTVEALKIFQTKEDESVGQKIDHICRDLTYNVTRIYQREDMIIAAHLVYCSALEFDFLKEEDIKGRVEALIIGDKGCGKSVTVKQLVNHFKSGAIVTAENLSYAGLVGGILDTDKKRLPTWGILPTNDRRMVAIEETSSMPLDDIAMLSGLRSSGIAEINKIQFEKTPARVRMLWLGNARSGNNLNTYSHGIIAVKELIGAVEDIRRFDFAMTVAEADVDLTDIMKEVNKNVTHTYTSEAYKKLILWIWSRKKENIIFDELAINRILVRSNDLANIYSSAIPLVEPTEQRIKLARLSCAIAGWLFSTDAKHNNIIVKEEHVDFVYEYLCIIYDKPSMSYGIYSKHLFKRVRISDDMKLLLKDEFKQFYNWDVIRDALSEHKLFRKSEFIDMTGMQKEEVQEFFRWAAKKKCISSTPSGFVLSPVFMALLKDIRDDINDHKIMKNEKGAI